MIIGITGGSGCGKTTLLGLLEQRGGVVLDCDRIYHRLLETDARLVEDIGRRFPGVVEDGVLLRKKLGEIVFSDPQALKDLNDITHAAITKEVLCQLKGNPTLVAIDASVLLDSPLAQLCDVTVAVLAPVEQRLRRLAQRDGISEEYARRRISAQPSDGFFREKCDYILVNDGDLSAFERKCLAFFTELGIMER